MIPSLPSSCALLSQISLFYLRDCGASPHHDGVLPCAASLGVSLPLPCQRASSPSLWNVSLFSPLCCFCLGASCPDLYLSPSCASFHLPLYTASSWEDSLYCLRTAALKPTVKSMWAKGSQALSVYFRMKEAEKKIQTNKKNHRASTALYPYNPQSAVLEEKWSSFTPRSTAKQQHLSQDAPLDRR